MAAAAVSLPGPIAPSAPAAKHLPWSSSFALSPLAYAASD
jgi:hypothetical protein